MFLLNVNSILTMILSALSVYQIYRPGTMTFRVILIVLGFLNFSLSFWIALMNRRYAKQNNKQTDMLWEVNTAGSLLVVLASWFPLTGAARMVFTVCFGFAFLSNMGELGLNILNAAGKRRK